MWHLFGLMAPLLILSGAAAAAPATSNVVQTTTQFTPKMLQCDSPDPARAIIGCDAVIGSTATPQIKSIAYSRRGVAYERRGDYDRAIADLNEAVRIDPKSVNALRVRGNYYRDQNDFEHALENYNRAIEDFDQALALIPNSAHALFNRGIVKMRKGDRMGGRADIAQAKLLDPSVGN